MSIKLYDSELKVMEVLWAQDGRSAREIAALLQAETGWNVNTTYTVIKKCIAKGAIERREPNFLCHALIARDVVQAAETQELLHKLFDSSPDLLFASLLGHQKLSQAQIDNLRRMVSGLQAQEEEP